MILNNLGLDKTIAKEAFKERIRKANNAAYSFYIQSLNMANDNERLQLLIKAVESHKNYPEAQYQIGKIYFQKKECGYAISHLIFGEQDYR